MAMEQLASENLQFLNKFDFDGDNILNTQEKKEWLKQLKNGYEDNLYWDPISNNGHRVVQKGGKIIANSEEIGNDNEDIENKGDTLTALKLRRKSKWNFRLC